MSAALGLVVLLLASYLVGAFPTSVVVGRLFFHRDIRAAGSGNAGGANAFRVFGWKAGLGVIIADLGKGVLAALLISRLGAGSGLPTDALRLMAGSAAVVGHIWTVFAGFRGGKGVATAGGALFAVAPAAVAIAALVFVLVILSSGIVSLGSISAALAFPLALIGLGPLGHPASPVLLGFALVLAPLIVFTHRSNIRRLFRGEESRFDRLRIFKRLFGRGS